MPDVSANGRFLLHSKVSFEDWQVSHQTILPVRGILVPPFSCLILEHIVQGVSRKKRENMESLDFLVTSSFHGPKPSSPHHRKLGSCMGFVLKAIPPFCLPTSVVSA